MYNVRPFHVENDYQQMRELLIQTYPLSSPPLNCLVGEIDWWRSHSTDPNFMRTIQLWFDAKDVLVAFTWPKGDQIEVMIHPDCRNLEKQIFTKLEAEFRQANTGENAKPFLHFWSYEQDPIRNSILQSLGYQRVDEEFLACHRMKLTTEIPVCSVTEGYTVRGFAGESEIESRVEAHRSAFHPSKITVEKHRLVMASPTYRQDLDIVCVASDGTIAACSILWFDDTNRVGIFEPIACHVDHQRRGLARAMMTEGLRRLKALGADTAMVMSFREDSPGASTYRSLGFEIIGKLFQWKKELS